MAVLEKIRVKMGVFISIVIGIALISFIVDADTLQSAVSMFSSKYNVGEMNGKKITYQDFQKKVEYFTQIHQMASNSSTMDEQTQEMINQSAWQDFLSEYVLVPAIENAGLNVGEKEMLDLTSGNAISPVLAREQSFVGENGQFDKNRLVEFIKAIPSDNSGNLEKYWNYLEKNIKNEQMFTKYISLLAKSNISNPVQLKRAIAENNVTSDVSFIIQPYGFAEDTTISVTSQEIKEYYNKHKNNFEQVANRDIEYAVFSVEPSAEDIKLAEADARKMYDEFVTTPNVKSFLARNSEKQLNPRFFKSGELTAVSPIVDSFAFKAGVGAILPLYRDGYVFRAAKVVAVKQLPDSVNVQHILIANQDKAAAKKMADSLINVIEKGADFNQIAAANSLDKNPNNIPGELGWMTQGYMIPGFDTCFVVAPNKCFTVETNYGLHIVRVKERTAVTPKVQVAIFEKSAVAGKETYQSFYTKANELASKAEGNYDKFIAAAKELNAPVVPANGILEGAKTVATYKNAREISRWIFEAEKKGEVSQILSVDNKHFFVVAVTGIHEAGIPAVDEVKTQITSLLRREKAIQNMVAKTKENINGLKTLDEIAAKLGATVSKQSGISFGAVGTQAFDPKFIGAVCGAKENVLTGPVEGSVGVYVFNVDARQTGAFFTEDDAKKRSLQMFSYQIQLLPNIFEKAAKVKDNRPKFF